MNRENETSVKYHHVILDESKQADDAEQRADTAEVIIAKYKEKYGELA